MPRFSLKQLLILVAFASVACAALARPSYWWHATIVTAVVVTAIGMLIVAVSGKSQRPFAVGWLVLAVGYLAVVLGPWAGQQLGPQLASSKGLARLESAWHGDRRSSPALGYTVLDTDGDGVLEVWLDRASQSYDQPVNVSGTIAWNFNTVNVSPWQPNSSEFSSQYTLFEATGHWLLAIVLGHVGGLFAAGLVRHRGSHPS